MVDDWAIVVGVNRHTDATGGGATGSGANLFTIDPAVERQQIDRVRAVRAGRSESVWRAALDDVRVTATGSGNLLPPIITAVEAHATLGEIADTLRTVFGEHRDTSNP